MSIPGSASPLFFGAGAAEAAAFTLQKSVRFNAADTPELTRTPSSAGNTRKFTISFWAKRCKLGSTQMIGQTGDTYGNLFRFYWLGDDSFVFHQYDGSSYVMSYTTTAKYRDPSAWYHYVISMDTTLATATDRARLYVNGVEVTDFSTENNPAQNLTTGWNAAIKQRIGREYTTTYGNYYNYGGYLADFYNIDGQQLDCTSFGEFDDNGVWQAAAYSGTYGTNGFHLFDFASESGIGNDSSGNDNDFTVSNITNVEANNTDGIDNLNNITQLQEDSSNVTINLANLQSVMNSSEFQDADTDQTSHGIRVGGTVKKFGIKWSGLTGLTGISLRWQRASGYDADVKVTGTGITEATTTLTSSRVKTTFSTTSTTGQMLMEDVTTGNTNGFMLRCIEFDGYGSVTYPTNVENFVLSGGAGQDVLFDVPTNGTQSDTGAGGEVSGNYATFNPLMATSEFTYANGNLETSFDAGDNNITVSTIAPKSGKWYAEIVFTASGVDNNFYGEVAVADASKIGEGFDSSTSTRYREGSADIYGAGTATGTKSDFAVGDVMGVAVDADNDTVYFYKNNTLEGTVTGLNFDGYAIGVAGNSGTNRTFTAAVNFGQRRWVYSAPSGYKALCTTNLPTPTIADGSDYFDAAIYTGTGSNISVPLEFEPDFVWTKCRSATSGHVLQNRLSGITTKYLQSQDDDQEYDGTGGVQSTSSTGFVQGTGSGVNTNNETYVSWAWDGGSSTVSNTDGDITSSVRANQTAGFSIVTYTGNGTAGETIGHGLNDAPGFYVVKRRDAAAGWRVYHSALGATKYIGLDVTDAAGTATSIWNDTEPTSSVFSIGSHGDVNNNNSTFLALCFSPVAGYSSFGSYEGNGNADGRFVYTGFRPALVIIKIYSGTTSNWVILDSARDPDNVVRNNLYADATDAENQFDWADFLSNGFKLRVNYSQVNGSSYDYIYMAWAENPFSSNGGLAR